MTKKKREKKRSEIKRERRERLKLNRVNKPKASRRINGKIKPIKERCTSCGRKVTHHHFLCNRCWKKDY